MKKIYYSTNEAPVLPKRKTYSAREKAIYNRAIKRCANLVATYDGIIPDEFERGVIVTHILKFTKK